MTAAASGPGAGGTASASATARAATSTRATVAPATAPPATAVGATPTPATPTSPTPVAGEWFRDAGLARTFREVLPESVDLAVYALTQLGDAWLLVGVLSLFYWYGPDRRRGALAVALGVGAFGLVVGLKAAFGLARPGFAGIAAEGYGFPSGHALGATVVWGALALLAEGPATRRGRLGGAAGLVALVATTRLALGVHYLGDVLAGAAVGAAFLAAVLTLADGDPFRAFAVAAAVAAGAVAVGGAADAVAALGGAIGGAVAFHELDTGGRVHPTVAAAALVVLGGLWAVVTAVEPPWSVVLVADAVVVGGVVAVPAVQRRVTARDAVAGGDGATGGR